jgi:hypothetical protein
LKQFKLVVRVKDQADVKHTSFVLVRPLAAKHVEKIFCDAKADVRFYRLLAIADAVPRSSNRTDLAGKTDGGFDRVFAVRSVDRSRRKKSKLETAVRRTSIGRPSLGKLLH